MDTLYTFWDNLTHYKTKSVDFLGLMNSSTKGNGGMGSEWGTIITTITTILPFPTNKTVGLGQTGALNLA